MSIRLIKRPSIIGGLAMFFLACFVTLTAPTHVLAQSGAAQSQEQTPFEATKPALQIPIPNLHFSDVVVNESGDRRFIDIPFLADYITTLYRYLVGIAGVLASIIIMVGGLQYLTARGDAGRVAQAKERITNAVVGLLLSVGGYLILVTVNPDLVQFKALQIETVKALPFDQLLFDKPVGSEGSTEAPTTPTRTPSSVATTAVTPPAASTQLDRIFQAYATCYDLDWRFLKGVANAESGLQSNSGAGKKYQGLFQESEPYCNQGIVAFPFLNCKNRLDPEANTAAAANIMGKQAAQILGACPGASVVEVVLLMYVAHNNGPAVMNYMLKNGGCSEVNQRIIVRRYYEEKCKTGCTVPRSRPECLTSHIHPDCGERKWQYGYKIVKSVLNEKAGVRATIVDKTICPRTTGKRVFPQ